MAAAETEFHFDQFHRSDVNVWVDYEIERQVFLRGTLGRMHVAAYNAGKTVTIDGTPSPFPRTSAIASTTARWGRLRVRPHPHGPRAFAGLARTM